MPTDPRKRPQPSNNSSNAVKRPRLRWDAPAVEEFKNKLLGMKDDFEKEQLAKCGEFLGASLLDGSAEFEELLEFLSSAEPGLAKLTERIRQIA